MLRCLLLALMSTLVGCAWEHGQAINVTIDRDLTDQLLASEHRQREDAIVSECFDRVAQAFRMTDTRDVDGLLRSKSAHYRDGVRSFAMYGDFGRESISVAFRQNDGADSSAAEDAARMLIAILEDFGVARRGSEGASACTYGVTPRRWRRLGEAILDAGVRTGSRGAVQPIPGFPPLPPLRARIADPTP